MKSTRLKDKLDRRLARIVARRKLPLPSDETIVSFTFDDVPRSACEAGAEILERRGARGTYFICGGFDGATQGQEYFRGSDLRRLHEAGHEIGSHGFAHLDYQSVPISDVQADIAANDDYLASIGLPEARSFAYPFGCVNSAVKRVCAARFAASRGVEHKSNHGAADLNLLKSVRLYSGFVSPTELAGIFDDAGRMGGWLVFMTHAISDEGGEFDCTPGLLEQAVGLAVDRGFPVLTISAARERLGAD